MTLEEFRATRIWSDDLGESIPECNYGEQSLPVRGWIYLDELIIEEVAAHWPADARKRGKWYLLIDRDEYITDDLARLEEILYRFAVSSGACEGDEIRRAEDEPPDEDDTPPTAAELRALNLRTIDAMYGTTDGIGFEMLMIVARKYLLPLLPDEAIAELAEMHLEHERRMTRESERRHRGL